MKKILMKTGLAVAAAMMVMTGCGNNSTTETTTAKQDAAAATEAQKEADDSKLTDEAVLKMGEYKGLSHTKERDEVTDGEVEAYIHSLAVKYPPEITDRAAALGDTANIDYEGVKDGVAFEGGTAYSYDLKLGSGDFIAGFEDAVVGMMPGESRDVPLTFPENYRKEEMAGEDVVFHVTLNHVTNPDEIAIDDALAKRVNHDENATLEQLKAESREKMELKAEVYYYLESAAELLTQVVANAEVTVDPDAAEAAVEEFRAQYTAQAALYGMDYKTFLSAYMSTTPEKAEEDVVNSLKEEMVMNEIISVENIQATDEQKAMVVKINGCETQEEFAEIYGQEQADKMYGMYAGTYFLIENAAK